MNDSLKQDIARIINIDATPLIERGEELSAAYERVETLEALLDEARMQIEYLHFMFHPSDTSEAVLGRIYAALVEPFPCDGGTA